MNKAKLIPIQLPIAKQLVRLLHQYEQQLCVGCSGELHEESCPAAEAYKLINYLKQRINNPNRNFTW